MNIVQIMFLVGVLVACIVVLLWLIRQAQNRNIPEPVNISEEREKIPAMLAKLKDYSSISAYKSAYKIDDSEILEKKKDLD